MWLILALALSPQTFAQSADQRYAAGLRQRRLYDLSAEFCRERLADPSLTPVEQSELVLQWAQSLVARASSSELTQQDAAWNDARQALANFLRAHPEHPRREVIMVQHALTLLARGQSLRQEWELAPEQPDLKSRAAANLRDAVVELEAAARLIGEDILPQRQRQRRDEELSTAQLLTLQNNIQFQLAQCHLNSALLYGDGEKATRVDALAQIEQRLGQLGRRVQSGDPLKPQIDLLQVECSRRLGQFAQAQRQLDAIDQNSLADELRGEYWNERMQLAIAQKQIDQAITWLPQVAPFYTTNPKLCLSLVQLFLAVAAAEKDNAQRQAWQQRAEQMISALETYHGAYWTRKANLLLLSSADRASPASSATLIVRLVDELLRKNQADEALRLLDLAANQAVAENRRSAASELAFRAAQLQQQRGLHQDAADRFRLLAAAFADQPVAATAHLSAGWNIAQLLAQQPQILSDYVNLLREHLATWPNDPTSDQAAVWLAPILARQGLWLEAFNVAANVTPASKDFAKAVDIGSAAALAELERTAAAEPKTLAERSNDIDRALTQWLERSVPNAVSGHGSSIGRLKLTQAIVSLAFRNADAAQTAKQLDGLLQTAIEPPPSWRDSALAWRALCQAADLDQVRAEQLGQLTTDESNLWLQAAQKLATDTNRAAIAQLIIDESSQIQRQVISTDSLAALRWQIALCESRWALGQFDAAAEQFTILAAQHPRSLDVQLRLARMLAQDTNGQWTDRALAAWRAVAAGSQPRSDAWFEAKLEIARLMIRDGQKEDAAKFLLYLKTVPPGWENSSLKSEFESLLSQAQR